MGSFFRSEEMALCQLFIQPEAAYLTVAELGEAGIAQFRDLNLELNVFQRRFVNDVKRCDELERQLRYIEKELSKDEVAVLEPKEVPAAPNPREMANLEAIIEKTEMEIQELSQNGKGLKSNFLELRELEHLLNKADKFFESGGPLLSFSGDEALDTHEHLEFVAGVIPRERFPAFERMLWRVSRGNVFLRQDVIEEVLEDPSTEKEVYKTAFVAFFQGTQLKTRIMKICAGFRASLYPCPSLPNERKEMLKGVHTRIEDLNLVLNQTEDHRHRVLVSVAKELHNWKVMVHKMKAIFHILNMFDKDVTQKCLIAECWVPKHDIDIVQKALDDGGKACGSSVPSFLNVIETSEEPPTFHRTNKFTKGFQSLIDSYGVASYGEVNPGLYTIVTFPFLFAVMFGDAGHGLIVALFGLYMVIYERRFSSEKSDNEIWNMFFGGRYIILLMGIFSIYTGFLYNDVFSKSMNIFGSGWSFSLPAGEVSSDGLYELDPYDNFAYTNGTAYTMGIDPVWQSAANKIRFLNSFKMKLSIVFGVVHMVFGVILSVVNHVHFRRKIYILLEFLPQIIFLIVLFAYLVAMMFMKWLMYYPQRTKECSLENCTDSDLAVIRYGISCAPSVLILFINMMLFKSSKPEGIGCEEFMFDGQKIMQQVFVFSALLCIPLLLLGKPLYILYKRRHRTYEDHSFENGDVSAMPGNSAERKINKSNSPEDHSNEEEKPIADIFIDQGIHTIEYILSSISHTASYLRLWALSLAHAQLSEVLWGQLLSMGLHPPLDIDIPFQIIYGLILAVLFSVWAFFTVAILVTMEGLSAFLHTLRLHWVEFTSKFYEGAGYAFQPFSFNTMFENENTLEE